MAFIFNLLKGIILAPFKIVRFITVDIVFGIISGVFSLLKGAVKMIFRPFFLLLLAAGAAAFYFASEEQKKKVKALMGM
jgi:hypothetical protein